MINEKTSVGSSFLYSIIMALLARFKRDSFEPGERDCPIDPETSNATTTFSGQILFSPSLELLRKHERK